MRHDAEPRPADRRQPPPAERRGPRRGRRHVAAARPRRELDPGRDPPRRRPRRGGRAARRRASSTCASRAASTASRPTGPVPPGDSFTLQFADPPRRARAEAPGWDVSGLRADGPAEPSILLTRRLAARGGASTAEGRYAPWLEVTRTLGFGVTWTVETRVRRVTPVGAPIALRVPLLPGEAPTRANLVVENGEVAVSLGGDETEAALGVDARAGPAGRPARPRGPPVVRGVAPAVQPDLVLRRRPASRPSRASPRASSPPSTAPGRARRSPSASPTRRASRARPSRSTT